MHGDDDRCLHVTLPVAALPEMLTKPLLLEQPLLPVLDVFGADWVRPFEKPAVSSLPHMIQDQPYLLGHHQSTTL